MSPERNRQQAEHECSHMTVASVFGAEPQELWLGLDGAARRHPRSGLPLAGGALFEIEAELQQMAITAAVRRGARAAEGPPRPDRAAVVRPGNEKGRRPTA